MTTIKQILQQSQEHFGEIRTGEILLGLVLNASRAYLYTYPEKILSTTEIDLFQNLTKRYTQGEPIAYIIGKKEFYSLDFKVTQDTLIPRPETEMLVDEALKKMPDAPCSILELGTGSGAIAITLAKLKPQVHFIATDISAAALKVAKENARRHKIDNIEFVLSDWFHHLGTQVFDMIISNPPYVAQDDHHLENLSYEPINALKSGVQGLDDLAHIISHARDYLMPKGWLLLEHGYDQKELVQELLKNAKFQGVETLVDLAGQPRITVGQNSC